MCPFCWGGFEILLGGIEWACRIWWWWYDGGEDGLWIGTPGTGKGAGLLKLFEFKAGLTSLYFGGVAADTTAESSRRTGKGGGGGESWELEEFVWFGRWWSSDLCARQLSELVACYKVKWIKRLITGITEISNLKIIISLTAFMFFNWFSNFLPATRPWLWPRNLESKTKTC